MELLRKWEVCKTLDEAEQLVIKFNGGITREEFENNTSWKMSYEEFVKCDCTIVITRNVYIDKHLDVCHELMVAWVYAQIWKVVSNMSKMEYEQMKHELLQLKEYGYEIYASDNREYDWFFVVTPKQNLLYIKKGYLFGFNVYLEYYPVY